MHLRNEYKGAIVMKNREDFLEIMEELVILAKTSNNTLTMDEIKEAFKDTKLDEDKFEPIYAYLLEKKITIKNYIPLMREDANGKEDEKESAYLHMYLSEMGEIMECSNQELEMLYEKINLSDTNAKSRIIEGNLKLAATIAGEYRGKGMTIEDLIQEGNMGLMNGVNSLKETKVSNVKEHLEKEIRKFIEDALTEYISEVNLEQEAVEKVNRLSKAAKDLEEELGRAPDVLELASYLNTTKEEIEDIIRLSNDALKEEPHHHD